MMRFSWKTTAKLPYGVLCGAESSLEWMLPWWWSRYIEHNIFPVTFIDFGMTDEMRNWCAERGDVVSLQENLFSITPRCDLDEHTAKEWEQIHGWRIWSARHTWFKKPAALLHSPYKQGLWIDLDCEILGALGPLFEHYDKIRPIAMVREYTRTHLPRFDPDIFYNGGVIVFQHGAKILEQWAENAAFKNHLFQGDDHLLSHLICQNRVEVQELPEIYNWRMAQGLNLDAVVVHWVGPGGKSYVRAHGGLKPSLDTFYQRFKGK